MDILVLCLIGAAGFLSGIIVRSLWPKAKAEVAHFEVIATQDVEAWFEKLTKKHPAAPAASATPIPAAPTTPSPPTLSGAKL